LSTTASTNNDRGIVSDSPTDTVNGLRSITDLARRMSESTDPRRELTQIPANEKMSTGHANGSIAVASANATKMGPITHAIRPKYPNRVITDVLLYFLSSVVNNP
jgi:hypothetical protein